MQGRTLHVCFVLCTRYAGDAMRLHAGEDMCLTFLWSRYILRGRLGKDAVRYVCSGKVYLCLGLARYRCLVCGIASVGRMQERQCNVGEIFTGWIFRETGIPSDPSRHLHLISWCLPIPAVLMIAQHAPAV